MTLQWKKTLSYTAIKILKGTIKENGFKVYYALKCNNVIVMKEITSNPNL